MLRDALLNARSCNIFYLPAVVKLDLFPVGRSPFDTSEFARRSRVLVRPPTTSRRPSRTAFPRRGGTASYGAACVLTRERTQLTLVGDQLTAHSLKYSLAENRAQEQCTLEWAAMLTSPCTYQIDITATALAAAASGGRS